MQPIKHSRTTTEKSSCRDDIEVQTVCDLNSMRYMDFRRPMEAVFRLTVVQCEVMAHRTNNTVANSFDIKWTTRSY
jgi:hypothetical protein